MADAGRVRTVVRLVEGFRTTHRSAALQLTDTERMRAWEVVVRSAVREGCHVIDASGKFAVLAVLALRCGAARVDVVAPADRAAVFRKVLSMNQCDAAGAANVVAHRSRDFPCEDWADVLLLVDVHNPFAFVESVPKGLGSGLTAAPLRARAFAVLVWVPPQSCAMTLPFETTVNGFDLSPFNALGDEEEVAHLDHVQLDHWEQEPTLIAEVDIARLAAWPPGPDTLPEGVTLPGGEGCGPRSRRHALLPAARANALIVWWDLDLDGTTTLSQCPRPLRRTGAVEHPPTAPTTVFATNGRHGVVHVSPPTEGSAQVLVTLKENLRLALRVDRPAEPSLARAGAGVGAARWHFPMMHDLERNTRYDEAITATVRKLGDRSVTLDIGAGSGLLAMMAARAGAVRVSSVEVEPHVAQVAQEVVDRNGLVDRVSVHNVHSTELKLEHRAELVISEVLDVGLLGEGVLPTLEHAWQHLLAPGARCVPEGAVVHAVLVRIPPQPYALNFPLHAVCGVDVRCLVYPDWHRYSGCRLHELRHDVVSPVVDVFEFDFYRAGHGLGEQGPRAAEREETLRFPVDPTKPAPNAVVFWFTLRLDESTRLTTAPTNKGTCWGQAVQLFPEDLAVATRDGAEGSVELVAKHSRKQISFRAVLAHSNSTGTGGENHG